MAHTPEAGDPVPEHTGDTDETTHLGDLTVRTRSTERVRVSAMSGNASFLGHYMLEVLISAGPTAICAAVITWIRHHKPRFKVTLRSKDDTAYEVEMTNAPAGTRLEDLKILLAELQPGAILELDRSEYNTTGIAPEAPRHPPRVHAPRQGPDVV